VGLQETIAIPLTMLFFLSCQFQLTVVALHYFLAIPTQWGSTVKESSHMSCFRALGITLYTYCWQYLLVGTLLAGWTYAVITYHLPLYNAWGLMSYGSAVLLGPILLNPYITSLSF
jgi:hypothetical protein